MILLDFYLLEYGKKAILFATRECAESVIEDLKPKSYSIRAVQYYLNPEKLPEEIRRKVKEWQQERD